MPLTLDGTTGVSAVQAGAVESGDLPAGSVIQVVQQVTSGEANFTSTSFFDTGFSIDITPTNANSKILVMLNGGRIRTAGTSVGSDAHVQIRRGNTEISPTQNIMRVGTLDDDELPLSLSVLDTSHNTTNNIKYKVYALSTSGDRVDINVGQSIGFSITAMEIAG